MSPAIAAMSPQDRALAKRVDELVRAAAPELTPKTWYGMPAYAKDGKVVVFLQERRKVQVEVLEPRLQRQRESRCWFHVAHEFALTKLTPADEKMITSLVTKAVS